MKINYIRLVGYIGIYNGMGLEDIAIDFSKSKYKKVVIKGANGSGKSTLTKALHVMPDSNSSLIPTMECRKEITLTNNDIMYNIQIIHPITSKGERGQTKAYIQKISGGESIELNPNGNIRSYKDAVFTELNLDPNFIALSQLSGENKGLASLKPADRKRFVNSIIGNISAYNDLNKSFTKKANEFRAMRNSIISKIDNLGDVDKLNIALNSINIKWNMLTKEKEDILQAISSEKTKINMLDEDNKIQDKFNIVSNNVNIAKRNLQDLNKKLAKESSKFNCDISKESLTEFHTHLSNQELELLSDININEQKVNSLLNDREEDAKRLQELSGKLKGLESNSNNKDKLKSLIEQTKLDVNSYSKTISNMKIKDINNISKEEFILALDSLHDIEEMVSNLKASYNYDLFNSALYYIENGLQVKTEWDSEILESSKLLECKKKEYIDLSNLKSKISILDSRPSKCKIDSCPLIKEALDIQSKYSNLDNDIIELSNVITSLEIQVSELRKSKETSYETNRCKSDIEMLIRCIDRNATIIRKLIVDEKFLDTARILDILNDNNIFNELQTIYSYIDAANVIDYYKTSVEKLKDYTNEYNILEQKEFITDGIVEQIKYTQSKFDEINKTIKECNKIIVENKNTISTNKSVIIDVEYILSLYEEIEKNEKLKEDMLNEFETIKNSMKSIKQSVDNIDMLTNRLNQVNKELVPLNNEKDKVQHAIKLLIEYQEDLKVYNEKYELIETLKKYSSPTTGIQTIFINLYMNKSLSLANKLLQLMFDGKYVLCQFVINDHEFRIPCMGSGLLNDDISSMSTSETCMISMILSFAILQQASTDYNILILDEIDGGLDTHNRLTFLNVLEELINMLNVEQCFIISHNDEINLKDCDIIMLKSNGQYSNIDGNVIFKY